MCDCSLFRFDKHAVSVMQCMYTGSLASADSTCVVSTNAEFQKNPSCRFCVSKIINIPYSREFYLMCITNQEINFLSKGHSIQGSPS